ncbi:MAG: phage portal protein [Prevotellaceae bacterium]|jgi:SPP1 family phage portal protein|nr:phage portal protein [Prevotellaceae bacterium]
MDITQLLKENSDNTNAIIEKLKSGRNAAEPDVDLFESQLNPAKHDVMQEAKRPNKKTKEDISDEEAEEYRIQNNLPVGYTGGIKERTRPVKVARIALALQKLIVKRAVAFTFGNPIILNAEPESDNEKVVLKAVKNILLDTKSRTTNRKIAREIFSFTEAAELWYPVPVDNHIKYGFDSKFKLRVAILTHRDGNKIYPYFDETGDMTAFSREFLRVDDKKNKYAYFETYTSEAHYLWKQDKGQWEMEEGYPKPNVIGKIPVIYGQQPSVEWEDVQKLIERLEELLSNFADTNDYHASPKIIVKGELMGFAKKGETGAILQLEGDNADAKYLSWDHAPESVKLEIETLLRMIYTITQTPDISFDSIKGIGAISGIALKLLFMDAHLKVQDKMEVFDDFLQRRLNIIKAYISQFNTQLSEACETLSIEPEIVPYMIEDEQAKVDLLITANGGKAVASQKTTVQQLGWVADAEAEYDQILSEEAANSSADITEPTV